LRVLVLILNLTPIADIIANNICYWSQIAVPLRDCETKAWQGAEGTDRPGRQSEGSGKSWGDKGASGISRLLGAAKLQSARSADNPRYTGTSARYLILMTMHCITVH